MELPKEFHLTKMEQDKLDRDKNKNQTPSVDKRKTVILVKMTKFDVSRDERMNHERDGVSNKDGDNKSPVLNWMRRLYGAIMNKSKTIPDGSQGHYYTLLDIWRSPRLRIYTIVLCYLK